MSAPFNDRGPFAVGEVCRIVRTQVFPELMGVEVTITGPLHQINSAVTGEQPFGYKTDLEHKGFHICPSEESLRRKPPAAESNERFYVQMWRDMAGKLSRGVPA